MNSGIVLTGGGAILEGLPEIAEQIFDLPIRRGAPMRVGGGLADHVNSPAFATAVGLAGLGQRRWMKEEPVNGAGAFSKVAGRIRADSREFL